MVKKAEIISVSKEDARKKLLKQTGDQSLRVVSLLDLMISKAELSK